MSPTARRLAIAASLLAILLAAAILGRGRMIGWVIDSFLEERGARCEGLSVTPGWDLSTVEVEATTCTLEGGRFASVSVPGGARVVLTAALAAEARSIHVPSLTVNPRDAGEAQDPGAIGAALLAGELPAPLLEALGALHAVAVGGGPPLPALSVDEVSVGRGDVLVLRRVSIVREGDALVVSIGSLGPQARAIAPLSIEVGIFDLEATTRGESLELSGALTLEVTGHGRARAVLFDVESRFSFRIEGRSLGSAAPEYRLILTDSPELERARTRLLEALRSAPEPTSGPTTRLRALRDAIARSLAERAEIAEREGGIGASDPGPLPPEPGLGPTPAP